MSLTITGLFTTAFALILGDTEVASKLVADILTIIGILTTWWGRYRHGDIHVFGNRR